MTRIELEVCNKFYGFMVSFVRTYTESKRLRRCLNEYVCASFQDQFPQKWQIERHIHFSYEFIQTNALFCVSITHLDTLLYRSSVIE